MGTFQGLVDNPLIFVKILIIIFLILYLFFALIVSKQIRIMLETINVGFQKPIKLIASLHLIFSFIVLILAVFIL